MDQRLQLRKIVDQEIGGNVFESFRRVAISYATRLNRSITPGEHVDGGVSDHPRPVTMAFGIGQNLKNPDWVRFLVIKAIAAVHGCEVFVDSKAIEHRTAEVNRLV